MGSNNLINCQEYRFDPKNFSIGELFKMGYSAVSQVAKRFEQKSKGNDKIKESLQKIITALKET